MVVQARVLMIDDDSAMRKALMRVLPEQGFDIYAVPSVREAVVELGKANFDLLLVDLHMPEISGDVFVRELLGRGSQVPIIVVSGTQRVSDVITMMRLGVRDFVHKPFAISELVEAMHRTLGTQPATRPSAPNPGARSGGHGRAHESSDAPTAPGLKPRRPQNRGVSDMMPKLLQKLRAGDLKLPVLDPRVAEIQNVMTTPEASIDEVLGIIERDPVLTASVLQTANSGYYSAGGRSFENLRDASVRIGNRQVLNVAMQVLIRSAFTCRLEPFRSMMTRAWENQHLTARILRRLAQSCGEDSPDALYVVGLLHNAGELVMLQLFSELFDGKSGVEIDPDALGELLDEYHERFGAALAKVWSQPPMIRKLIGAHHDASPGEGPVDEQRRHMVLTAWAMACRLTPDYFGGKSAKSPADYAANLPIAPNAFSELCEEVAGWRPQS